MKNLMMLQTDGLGRVATLKAKGGEMFNALEGNSISGV